MQAAGEAWLYSPTTLSVVTAIGTMLAGLAAVWVLLIAGPRYRLRYGPLKSRELPDGSWIVSIYLSSRGRRDITRQAFDQDDPIAIDIGAHILELKDVWSSHQALRTVTHRTDGTRLLIGPGLIGRRQDLRFLVITEAKPTRLNCQASLIDVYIRQQSLTPERRRLVIFYGAGALFAVVNSLLLLLLGAHGIVLNHWVLEAIVFFGIAALFAWVNLRFRYPRDVEPGDVELHNVKSRDTE